MAVFCYKKLEPTTTLGCRIRQKRETLGWGYDDLSVRTRIPAKYLQAIEEENFSALPKARAYRFAYIRECALELGLSAGNCLEQFNRENGFVDVKNNQSKAINSWWPFTAWSIFLRNILLASSVLLFAGYLIWQIRGIAQPPKLIVNFPFDGQTLMNPSVTVQGDVEKETTLTINNQNITVNDKGQFETKIDLASGLNTLTLTATKKHGKTTTVVRHVVVKQ